MIGLGLPRKETPRPRVRAVQKRNFYAGAIPNRITADWVTALISADQALRFHLRKLRERSRSLATDHPYGARFIQLLKTNVIGPTGIGLQSRILNSRGKLNRVLNEDIENAFAEWGQPEYASVDGRCSWIDIQNLMIANMAIDGEFLAVERPDPANPFRYTLTVLDPDQLDETWNRAPGYGVNKIIMGVELNERNRPVAYWIWSQHPTEPGSRVRERIPADQVIHTFVTLRPGQTRGVPWFTPVLVKLRLLDKYEEAELIASLAAATKPVFYEQELDTPQIDEESGEAEAPQGEIIEELEPGMAKLLPPGVKANFFDPKHPSGVFPMFEKAMVRALACGLNVAYSSLSGDLEAVNFSSIRAGLLDERDVYRGLQRFVIDHNLRRIARNWLGFASLTGQVRLPSEDVRSYARAFAWKPRGWQWVDPLNEIQTLEREIHLGINSRTHAAAERGRDFEEVLEQQEQEEELALEYGVNIGGTDGAAVPPTIPLEGNNGNGNGAGAGAGGDTTGANAADDGVDGDPASSGRGPGRRAGRGRADRDRAVLRATG